MALTWNVIRLLSLRTVNSLEATSHSRDGDWYATFLPLLHCLEKKKIPNGDKKSGIFSLASTLLSAVLFPGVAFLYEFGILSIMFCWWVIGTQQSLEGIYRPEVEHIVLNTWIYILQCDSRGSRHIPAEGICAFHYGQLCTTSTKKKMKMKLGSFPFIHTWYLFQIDFHATFFHI